MLVTAGEAEINLETPRHGHTSTNRSAKAYIHQLCADTGSNQEDLSWMIADWDEWYDFLLVLNNGFSLFFELLVNLATHITWPSIEDPTELCQLHTVDLSNTSWARKDLTKQRVGSQCGSHEQNSYKFCDS